MTPAMLPPRFARKVAVRENGCWEWTGGQNGTGYGQIRIHTVRHYTHRYSYELFVGPIPEGLHLDHLCRNTVCCNPKHLEPVTPRVNMLRGTSPGARAVRTDQCLRGHSLADAPNYPSTGNRRPCRTCREAYLRVYRSLSIREREHRKALGLPVVDPELLVTA